MHGALNALEYDASICSWVAVESLVFRAATNALPKAFLLESGTVMNRQGLSCP